jgi:hypothetical protein
MLNWILRVRNVRSSLGPFSGGTVNKGDPCETGLGGVLATFSDENSSHTDDRLQMAEPAHQEPEGLAEHAA